MLPGMTIAGRTVLSRRALGRATLARQQLLERSSMSVLDLTDELVGLQAQTPHSWYVGFWSRLAEVRTETISQLLESRELVRLALMRSTIHLVSAEDAVSIRPLLDAVLRKPLSNFGKHLVGLDTAELAAVGRDLLSVQPMMLSELGRAMARRWPDRARMSRPRCGCSTTSTTSCSRTPTAAASSPRPRRLRTSTRTAPCRAWCSLTA